MLGRIGKRRGFRAWDAEQQKPATGREPQGTRAVLSRETGERYQFVRMCVAECERDPKRNRAVPQWVSADHFGRCSRRQRGRRLDQPFDNATERSNSMLSQDVGRASLPPL